jgi:maltose O-acetyltransferase
MGFRLFHYLKLMKWDLSHFNGRFAYKWFLVKNIPGEFGRAIRGRMLKKYCKAFGENNKVFEGVTIRNVRNLSVGNNCSIGEGNFIQAAGKVTIGDNVLLGPGVKIWSTNHKYDRLDVPIREQGYEFKEVIIEDGVWIGANTFIMPGAIIKKGCVISANSVVGVKALQEYSILAGNPARKIGTRKNESSFEKSEIQ